MSNITPRSFLIDCDGTVFCNSYPDIGPDVPEAVRVLKRLNHAGHILIICTMRCDELLEAAEKWFQEKEIDITFSNCNPHFETGSRKIYGNYSIDDHNLMTPLEFNPELHHKPYVNWLAIEKELEAKGLI